VDESNVAAFIFFAGAAAWRRFELSVDRWGLRFYFAKAESDRAVHVRAAFGSVEQPQKKPFGETVTMRLRFALAPCVMVIFLASAARAQLPNPLLYYPFDNVDIAGGDFSGNSNGGALEGGAVLGEDASGRTGAAGDRALDLGTFNNGARVSVLSAAAGGLSDLVTNNAATVSLWTFGSEQQPVAQWGFHAEGPASGRILGAHLPWSDGTFYFDSSATGACCPANVRINAAAPSPDTFMGQWNHYAFVKDGPMTAVYINGELLVDSGTNVMDPLVEITAFTIGAHTNSSASYSGLYDDFALFDVALTPEQIADIVAGEEIPGIPLLGDFNDSGDITAADFETLATNLGAHLRRDISHADGDYDTDGRVTLHDFRLFKQNFPAAFAAATGVPEPASVVLVALAIGALLPFSLRRSKRK
jgi:hypothetical protein